MTSFPPRRSRRSSWKRSRCSSARSRYSNASVTARVRCRRSSRWPISPGVLRSTFPGSAKRIEELHRLTTRMRSFTKESERALAEAQMLFGAHMYARAKLFPDVAIRKGEEAYAAARRLGDGSLEFAAAGGIALVYADLGDLEEAERWLARAAEVASTAPTPVARAQARGLARPDHGTRRKARGHARAPGKGRAARHGQRPSGRALRGARTPRAGGLSIGGRARGRGTARSGRTLGAGGEGAFPHPARPSTLGRPCGRGARACRDGSGRLGDGGFGRPFGDRGAGLRPLRRTSSSTSSYRPQMQSSPGGARSKPQRCGTVCALAWR